MKFRLMNIILLLAMSSCGRPHAGSDLGSIYGQDDRKDLSDLTVQAWQVYSRSVVALVKQDKISGSRLVAETLGKKLNLCETERFREQPSVAGCSGFLAAPDTIITSGHCIKDATECADTRFVFDYGIYTAGEDPLNAASPQNVYKCSSILSRQYGGEEKTDYAVIRLDRAVVGRQPLQLHSDGKVDDSTPLVSIGTPSGLPMKVTINGKILKNAATSFFEANLDSFGGNSGGPVFNGKSGFVEGIVVRGREDYNIEGACTTSYVYAENSDSGEDVTRATILAQALRGGVPPNPPTPPNPPAPIPQSPAPAPPTPPGPGWNVNPFADMVFVSRSAYLTADDAEDIARRTTGVVQNVATDLHYAASTMYRSALRISRSPNNGNSRVYELENFARNEMQSVMTKIDRLKMTPAGSAGPYVGTVLARIDERMRQVEREILGN